MATASSSLSVGTSYTSATTTGTGGTDTDAFSDNYSSPLAAGTAANQADVNYSESATLVSTTHTLILSALSGPRGQSLAMARVKKYWIRNLATVDGNTLTVQPGATHPITTGFTGVVTIPAGGAFLLMGPLATGFVITSGSADQITLTATGTVPYKVELDGCSV